MSGGQAVSQVYRAVIDDVIKNLKLEFQLDNVDDDAILDEIKVLWENKLDQSGVLQGAIRVTDPKSGTTVRPNLLPGSMPNSSGVGMPGFMPSGFQFMGLPAMQGMGMYPGATHPLLMGGGIPQMNPVMQHQFMNSMMSGQSLPQQTNNDFDNDDDDDDDDDDILQADGGSDRRSQRWEGNITVETTANADALLGELFVNGSLTVKKYNNNSNNCGNASSRYNDNDYIPVALSPTQKGEADKKADSFQMTWPCTCVADKPSEPCVGCLCGIQMKQRVSTFSIPQVDGPSGGILSDNFDDDYDDDPLGGNTAHTAPPSAGPSNDGQLGSDDDEEDIDDEEPHTDNIVVCQYEKVWRNKARWKCRLKCGIMHLKGTDYVFRRAGGEFHFD